MLAYFHTAEAVLRRTSPASLATSKEGLSRLLACLLLFALAYGATMGTFRGIAGESQWLLQIAYSAVKVPILLMASFAISLPSFFVLNTLFGLRRDFPQALRAVVAAQTGLAIVLASLAPFTVLWYASSARYGNALLFNGAIFAVASLAAQWLLREYYRPLVSRNRRHRMILWGWLFIYALVAIQMAWLMRPFVGAPNMEVQFFRPDAWDNAYIRVLKLVADFLGW